MNVAYQKIVVFSSYYSTQFSGHNTELTSDCHSIVSYLIGCVTGLVQEIRLDNFSPGQITQHPRVGGCMLSISAD